MGNKSATGREPVVADYLPERASGRGAAPEKSAATRVFPRELRRLVVAASIRQAINARAEVGYSCSFGVKAMDRPVVQLIDVIRDGF